MAEGKLFINGVQHHDGEPVGVNGDLPIEKVMCNGILVWQNISAPTLPITDFNATDTQLGQITMTWSPSDGLPAPTYNVINVTSGATIATNVTSGWVYSQPSGLTADFRVDAINVEATLSSNIDNGTAVATSGSVAFPTDGTFIVPPGITSITVTGLGGGGGGSCKRNNGGAGMVGLGGGGFAGESRTNTITVTPGENIAVNIGAGAIGSIEDVQGITGEATSFGSYQTYAGGAGGTPANNIAQYDGVGATGCNGFTDGTYYDGPDDTGAFGGQASCKGNGGNGYNGTGGNGGIGAGGGGAHVYQTSGRGGNGGNGYISISW